MFVEELTLIKESENKADELQKKAKIDSKQALEAARVQAGQVVEEAQNRAKDIYGKLISEGQAASDEEYEAYLEKTRTSCAEMAEKARANEPRAVELIAERIVEASVNS